jgi:hypothetical protein
MLCVDAGLDAFTHYYFGEVAFYPGIDVHEPCDKKSREARKKKT